MDKEEKLSDEEVEKQFDKVTEKVKKGFKRLIVDFANEVKQSEKDLNDKFHFDKEKENEEVGLIKGGNDDDGNG